MIDPIITSALSSGMAVYIITQSLKFGRVCVSDYSVCLSYHTQAGRNTVDKIILDLQFTNTSGHSKIIRILNAHLLIANNDYELFFRGQPFPPAYVLKEKSTDVYNNELGLFEGNIELPLVDIVFDDAVFTIEYTVNGKAKKLTVPSNELRLKDTTINVHVW